MLILNDADWDWINPEQAKSIAQTPEVLGGRPRISDTRVSIAQIVDWVRRFGQQGAIEQLQACQPSLSLEMATVAVDSALAFAAAVLDRELPASLMRQRPEWAGQVTGWDANHQSVLLSDSQDKCSRHIRKTLRPGDCLSGENRRLRHD